jgi:hypothetical protein
MAGIKNSKACISMLECWSTVFREILGSIPGATRFSEK